MTQFNGFEKYVLSLSGAESVYFVLEQLAEGDESNHAWQFMAKYNGPKWLCKPDELPEFVEDTIIQLRFDHLKVLAREIAKGPGAA